MVTGHYIRGYDLPTLNAAYLEAGFSPLSDKLSQDTKLDLARKQGLGGSQRDLAAMLGVRAPKYAMHQTQWRSANRLEPEGIAETKRRATSDVRQHIAMRAALLAIGALGPPRVWRSIAR